MQREELWAVLTRLEAKVKAYERETYFRQGLADATELFCERFAETMRRAALLMVKPDGLVAGKAPAIVEFLRAHGYCIQAMQTQTLSRFHWRELWRFQLTSATLDRLAVNDLVFRRQALLLALVDMNQGDLPATVRLSVLKGPSDVASQPADCLRRLIGQPNRVFSFFHVADEPADLLRELGLLLDEPERRQFLLSFVGAGLSPVDGARLDEMLQTSARSARDLDPAAAVERALEAVDCLPPTARGRDQIRSALRGMRQGKRIEWIPFASAVQGSGIAIDEWDLAILGTSFITYDEPGHSKQIVAVDPQLWRSTNLALSRPAGSSPG
jgi:hypothetical protein